MQTIIDTILIFIQQGYLGLFIICFAINMIPFLSPSNMVLAGVAGLYWPEKPIEVGIIVGISATLAKAIHYFVVRGSRVVLSEERLQALDSERARVEKWGALALFIAAASPVPDDPLIVYVGWTKYSIPKFIGSYFIGKVAVTIAGAFIGAEVSNLLEPGPIVILSIALTAIITGILFKRKTEGAESDLLQDVLEESITDDKQPGSGPDGDVSGPEADSTE